MGNKATNTNVQIETLKGRGLILDYDDAKIKEYLLDIGYYRLGFYWHHFEIDDDHNFAKGSKLTDVIALYYLDVDLRTILLRYLNRIGVAMGSKLSSDFVSLITSTCSATSPAGLRSDQRRQLV